MIVQKHWYLTIKTKILYYTFTKLNYSTKKQLLSCQSFFFLLLELRIYIYLLPLKKKNTYSCSFSVNFLTFIRRRIFRNYYIVYTDSVSLVELIMKQNTHAIYMLLTYMHFIHRYNMCVCVCVFYSQIRRIKLGRCWLEGYLIYIELTYLWVLKI